MRKKNTRNLYTWIQRLSELRDTFKRTLPPHVLSPSYKRVTYEIYTQKFKFYAISLKTRVNRHIMKLDGKNIICVL